eukprot:TRINITY_DN60980_c0_g1_i1.p1 TRINITY_DN60980_c0_g1~~TRINITY_DN60980_c0_g1_i1.p1  ORF type:complete len:117 (-),score=9.18 TRINITY_DN60980_c0_g1_i1:19-369(-)
MCIRDSDHTYDHTRQLGSLPRRQHVHEHLRMLNVGSTHSSLCVRDHLQAPTSRAPALVQHPSLHPVCQEPKTETMHAYLETRSLSPIPNGICASRQNPLSLPNSGLPGDRCPHRLT